MIDITHLNRDGLPSNSQLFKATAIAVAIAGAILITTVLPAEYGIDPTGIGKRLGLTSMSAAATPKPQKVPSAGPDPSLSLASTSGPEALWKAAVAYRNDELSLTLQSGEGAEIKANMNEGDRFVFTWTAEGGAVYFDMHGEKLGAANDEFSSYWKGRDATAGHGEFQAPFAGRHGWYWRNRGDKPVTIKVKTSGFYEKLYKP